MIAGASGAIELRSLFKTHRNSVPPGELHNLFGAGILPAFSDENVLQWTPRLQSFLDRVNSSELVHTLDSLTSRLAGCKIASQLHALQSRKLRFFARLQRAQNDNAVLLGSCLWNPNPFSEIASFANSIGRSAVD